MGQFTNSGTDFWLAFTETYDRTSAVYWLNITSNDTTSGNVSIPGQSFSQNFAISQAGAVVRINIPPAMANIDISNQSVNKAIHVTSNQNVVVYAVTYHAFRHEASIVIPTQSLGTEYRVLTYQSELKSGLQESEFNIIPAGDTVVVRITPKGNIAGGANVNVPYTVTIPPGYVYQAQARFATDDLTGTLITGLNGKKFAVFGGNVWSTIVCTPNSDPLYEAMYPVNTWGKNYFVLPTPTVNKDYVRVLAHHDTTKVYLDGVLQTTLQAGQFLWQVVTARHQYTADKPIAVGHFLITGQNVCTSNSNTDPSTIILNATEQMFLDSISFFAVDTNAIDTHFVHVITRTKDTAKMYLDGVKMNNFQAFTMDTQYAWRTAGLLPGSHRLETSGCGFIAYSMGIGSAVSYGYATGVSLVDLQNSITYKNFITGTDTICIGDTVQFTSLTRGNPLSFNWDFGDGTGDTVANPRHAYSAVGTYRIKAVVVYECITDTLIDTIEVPPPPVVNLGPDTSMCNMDTLKFAVNTHVFKALWNNNSTDSALVVSHSGTYWVQVSNFCGVDYDTVVVDSLFPDSVYLGADTLLCKGDTLKLNISTISGTSYYWQNGDTTPFFNIDTGGLYWAEARNACGIMRDSLWVDFDRFPELDLGADTILCTGQLLTLRAFFSRSIPTWQDGSKLPVYTVRQPGVYHVVLQNPCGIARDTVDIGYDKHLQINLGNDSIICLGDTLILDPNTLGAFCLWHSGSTDSVSFVWDAGTYWVLVQNACGNYQDTISFLAEQTPAVSLPPDTVLCFSDTIYVGVPFSRASYLWSHGPTTPNVALFTDGFFEVTVSNLCGSDVEDILVVHDRPIGINLGKDTVICDDNWFEIKLDFPNNPKYLWSTGETSNKLRIFRGGIFSVSVTNRCGTYTDSRHVSEYLSPKIVMPNDTVLCDGLRVSLDPGLENAMKKYANYIWNNGSISEAIQVDTSGWYSVIVQNDCGIDSGRVRVTFQPMPHIDIGDSIICEDLFVAYNFENYPFYQFTWPDNTNGYRFSTFEADDYFVWVEDTLGCRKQFRFNTSFCASPLIAPNSFTPNKDRKNEGFRVYKTGPVYDFRIQVLNRWNEVMFESSAIEETWDGTRRGGDSMCPVGTYVWKVEFREEQNHQLQYHSGFVNLIR